MNKVFKYVFADILRNKVVIGYTAVLLLISVSVFSLENNAEKGILTLLNLILFIVPLVSVIFSTIYVYNSSEFIELLVSQPLQRGRIWMSLFAGLAVSLICAFFIGIGIPLLLFYPEANGLYLIACGLFLSVIFVAIAMMAGVYTRDKAKGIGLSILLWIYFAILFDGLVLYLLFQFSDYPLERPMVFLSFLNPIDLCRVTMLLKLDISALMGYTGAVFKDYFGTNLGLLLTLLTMILWVVIPFGISYSKFKSKDL
jgi:Cu-processing system permease protein